MAMHDAGMAMHDAEVTVCLGGMGVSLIGGAGRQSAWDVYHADRCSPCAARAGGRG